MEMGEQNLRMDRRLRPARRPGITKALAIVAIILVGAAAAATGAAISLSQGGSASTSSSSTTSLVNALSSTTSLGSSSTSSVPCLLDSTGLADTTQLNATIGALVGNLTNAFNEAPGNATVPELFGNFSQMAASTDLTGPLGAASSSSYQVVGRPTIGSLEYYQVNFTTSSFGFNESDIVMFAPNGTATSVSSSVLGNLTGASAAAMGEADVSSFLIQFHTSAYASSIESDPSVAVLNSTTVSLGPAQVKMTYYTLKSLPLTYCGTTLSELVEGLGTVQGTGLTMLLYTQGADQRAGEHGRCNDERGLADAGLTLNACKPRTSSARSSSPGGGSGQHVFQIHTGLIPHKRLRGGTTWFASSQGGAQP